MRNTQATTTVALLYQTQDLGRHLRDALTSLGTPIVYEAVATDLDAAALQNSGARVVVVNLDPGVDADLDDVYGLLEDDRYNVIFNDAQVSSALSGWDQARWARHLAAKIVGGMDIDPPRPEGAEAIPVPVLASHDAANEAEAEEEDASTIEIASEPSANYNTRLQSIVESAPQEAAHETSNAGDPVDLLQSQYDAMHQPTVPFSTPPAQPADEFDFSTLEALTAMPAPVPPADASHALTFTADFIDESMPVSTSAVEGDETPETSLTDFAFDDEPDHVASAPQRDAEADEPIVEDGVFDLDALEKLFGEDNAAAAVPVPSFEADEFVHELGDVHDQDAPDAAHRPAEASRHAVLDVADIDESVAASGDAHDVDAPTLTLVEEFDFEAPAVPTPQEPAKSDATLKLAAAADWSLEDMLDADAPPPAPPVPSGPANFGIEKMSAAEYLAPSSENTAPPPAPDSSFAFELMPLEEAVAPQQVEREAHETWLTPEKPVAQAKIRRIWVLGASIGGPEAVRDFLRELPRDYPALFLLAQHMGAEFVDMMAQQLARATPMTVRTPTHGERVSHGEVIIVPTTQRLQIDPEGIVVLERNTEETPYNPSIDRVLHDVADRYGSSAGAIIFSGMTTDAIEGSKYLAQKGGTIYAQHPDSCVVSTMIDGVMDAGLVKFLGAPKELAEQLIGESAKQKR